MSFLSDLHTYWQSNSTLNSALAATQVYTGLTPENMALPYAVITPIALVPIFTCGAGYLADFTFQITVFDSDPDNVESVCNVVGGQFDYKQISANTISCIRKNGPILRVETDTPLRVYSGLMEYTLSENKAMPGT